MKKIKNYLKEYFPISIKGCLFTLFVFICAIVLCFALNTIDESNEYISMIFILAVFLISRFTDGYFYGTISSFISVLVVNFIFTYPYFNFNFTLSGYPLAIISMLAVAVITSALTTKTKINGNIQIEVEKEKTRSNLLRAVSHDLRTPLTSILGSTSAIIENYDLLGKEEKLKLLTEVREDAGWLIRMVENLLSITRIDGENSAKIKKSYEAAEELIGESVRKFKKLFPHQNVSVKVPDELLLVPMDPVLIEQVITNLLENSVNHSVTATNINLLVSKTEKDAIFEVSDNGMGISADVLPRIFESYYKHENGVSSDKKRNMGIGLSVCYTIIKAHNGTMTAENNKTGGAVFKFTLPLEEEEN